MTGSTYCRLGNLSELCSPFIKNSKWMLSEGAKSHRNAHMLCVQFPSMMMSVEFNILKQEWIISNWNVCTENITAYWMEQAPQCPELAVHAGRGSDMVNREPESQMLWDRGRYSQYSEKGWWMEREGWVLMCTSCHQWRMVWEAMYVCRACYFLICSSHDTTLINTFSESQSANGSAKHCNRLTMPTPT